MKHRIWIIVGATSIIAECFAHLAASAGHQLRLVGRDEQQLKIIAQDIQLRYPIQCDVFVINVPDRDHLFDLFYKDSHEVDLFLAHSEFTENNQLNNDSLTDLIHTNVLMTTLLIHHYLHLEQKEHNLLYLSSVAACRGRAKNSLYGASKAAIEVYLQGLQQSSLPHQTITIVRLGFIDTKQTYGLPGIFYAAPPQNCAKACWHAIYKKKRFIYYPGFWRFIMVIIRCLPFFIYKRAINQVK